MKNLQLRFSTEKDAAFLKTWLMEPGVLRWFPMCNEIEVDDAVKLWMSYIKEKAVVTATVDGTPCAISNFYLQPFKKLKHQSLFAIIVDSKFRGKGIGTKLINHMCELAKTRFHMEMLHLEVYEGNPALKLYERLGFKRSGLQKHCLKENGEYIAKIFMYKML